MYDVCVCVCVCVCVVVVVATVMLLRDFGPCGIIFRL
jgi:hypothetical protein